MKKFIVTIFASLMLVSFAEAGPFGLFGNRHGVSSCANGSCANGSCAMPAITTVQQTIPAVVPQVAATSVQVSSCSGQSASGCSNNGSRGVGPIRRLLNRLRGK